MLETVPTAGLTDQVTPVLVVPLTAAVNCWFCETLSDAVVGLTDRLTCGARETAAVPDFDGLPTVVAVTVTVCAPEMAAGAV